MARLDALIIATYALRGSERRRDALADAQRHLAMLRLLLRGAREQRHLSLAQHDHAVDACATRPSSNGGPRSAAAPRGGRSSATPVGGVPNAPEGPTSRTAR